jgi:hypothetical protein
MNQVLRGRGKIIPTKKRIKERKRAGITKNSIAGFGYTVLLNLTQPIKTDTLNAFPIVVSGLGTFKTKILQSRHRGEGWSSKRLFLILLGIKAHFGVKPPNPIGKLL